MDDFDVNGILEEPVDFQGADNRDFEDNQNLNLTHNDILTNHEIYKKAQLYTIVDMLDSQALENWYLRFDLPDAEAKARRIEELEMRNVMLTTEQLKKFKNGDMNNDSILLNQTNVNAKVYPNKGLLETPPLESNWIGISVGDSSDRKYIRLKEKNNEHRKLLYECDTNKDEIDPWSTLFSKVYNEFQEEKSRIHDTNKTIESVSENGNKLLIQKYQCNEGYFSLISDCSANRITLNWLKIWDMYVFGKKDFVIPDKPSWNERGIYDVDEGNGKRPKKKILGLFGPTGCCKTTLAKNIAKLCGYNIIYIAASDTLTVEQVKNKIERGISNVSMTFYLRPRDGMETDAPVKIKPNCVIIDDIDFASSELLDYLLKLSKEHGDKALKRPLILIGNNVYSSNLKELKGNIGIVKVSPIFSNLLLKRLTEICNIEGFDIKKYQLKELIEECYYDIRRCLNNLQLMFAGKGFIDGYQVHKEVSSDSSVVNNWEQIFVINRHWDSHGNILPLSERLQRVQNIIDRSEYADRLVFGLFQNTKIISNNSPDFNKKVSKIFEDIQLFYDTSMREQLFSLLRYRSAMVAKFHLVCAFKKPIRSARLKYDFTGPNEYRMKPEHTSILKHFKKNKDFFDWSNTMFFDDLLPYLIFILCPNVKHINVNYSSNDDIQRIQKSTKYMLQLNISIKEIKNNPNIYKGLNDIRSNNYTESTRFEPDITTICVLFYDSVLKIRNSEFERKMLYAQLCLDRLAKFEKLIPSKDETKSGKDKKNHIAQILSILKPNEDLNQIPSKKRKVNGNLRIYYLWDEGSLEIANTKSIRLCDF
ncbi:Chromosome transmission fidelity protein 18 homolog [Strongyloides ratti]|uniref:Chromosome transmission fidelity protein 18 homolog n=1 Tax=Strongyloides ratti TaxID=34506 RepID=A0A090L5N4_STRRB|nr:Chromosome transmission fidelity protein 18 homolog [Strongyloides ratti]CEF63427.1 Chromosome transmission fidelity protein 18 homolog [Strongyloides ratti]